MKIQTKIYFYLRFTSFIQQISASKTYFLSELITRNASVGVPQNLQLFVGGASIEPKSAISFDSKIAPNFSSGPTSLFREQARMTTSGTLPNETCEMCQSIGEFGTSKVQIKPLNGVDISTKNGKSYKVSTKMHCITAMVKCQEKYVDELRWIDYKINMRKK